MHKVIRRLCWSCLFRSSGAGPAASLIDSPAVAAPVNGGLIADPANPRRKQWRAGFMLRGEPEGFLYGVPRTRRHQGGDQGSSTNAGQGPELIFVIGFNDADMGDGGGWQSLRHANTTVKSMSTFSTMVQLFRAGAQGSS